MEAKEQFLPCLKDLEDWQIIIDACPRPAVILSPSQEIILANQAFGELLGDNKSVFRGKSLENFFEKQALKPRLPVQKVFSSGQRERISFPWRGCHWWADLMPLRDRKGIVKGVLVSFTNLQLLAETICSEGLFHLPLPREKESFSGKELEEKFEALGLFTKGVVHDLRNLLGVVEGNFSLALKASNPSQKEEFFKKTKKGLEKLKEFTERLLSYTNVSPSLETCNLAKTLEEETDLLLSDAEIECVLEVPEDLWPARIDCFRTSQILQNLLLNAKEALEGHGIITIKAENFYTDGKGILKEGPYVRLIISDNGPGIEPQILRRIFDPYFSTKKEGHGLGLALVYTILKAHGGHIEVFSYPGLGTTFVLYLPALMKDEPSKESNTKKSSAKASFYFVVKSKPRILVVEDEEELQDLYRDLLSFLGSETKVVSTAAEALEAYRQNFYEGQPFDLVIADFNLPDKDAFVLFHELKNINPEASLVLATGMRDPKIEERFKAAGVKAILRKPFGIEELAQILGRPAPASP